MILMNKPPAVTHMRENSEKPFRVNRNKKCTRENGIFGNTKAYASLMVIIIWVPKMTS